MSKEIKIKFKDKLITKTDFKGKIQYGNRSFTKISGYRPEEYLYKPHNIIRHPDMPKAIFKKMWQYIQKKENFIGIIKNLSKNGDYYWVVTSFEIETDLKGEPIGYLATRTAVPKEAKEEISNLYHTLLDIEKIEGPDRSYEYLKDFLDINNLSFKEFTEDLLKRKTIKEKLDL